MCAHTAIYSKNDIRNVNLPDLHFSTQLAIFTTKPT